MTLQLIVGGIASGSLYAMIGLAIVLVLKTTRVPNFAQGEMGMISTFFAYSLLQTYHVNWWLTVLATLVFAIVQGIVIQQIVIRPLLGAPILSTVIATLGLNIALHSIAGLVWGNQTYVFPSPFADAPAINLGGLSISVQNALTIGVATAMIVALSLFLQRTRTGLALRAASQNQSVARLMGIPVDRVFMLAWSIGSVLGAIAGVLVAPVLFLDTNLMALLLIKGFAGAVLGGLDSLGGAFVGGLLLGVIENLMGAYISPAFTEALSFVLIIAVLTLRPAGLFGRSVLRRI